MSSRSKRKLRYPDFEAVTRINQRVVSLTANEHAYTRYDERRLRQLIDDVKATANNEEEHESVTEKVSLLLYRIAGGQYFHEGNKRTAFETAKVFLRANGYSMDVRDTDLLRVIDRVAIGQASLSEVRSIVRRSVRSA